MNNKKDDTKKDGTNIVPMDDIEAEMEDRNTFEKNKKVYLIFVSIFGIITLFITIYFLFVAQNNDFKSFFEKVFINKGGFWLFAAILLIGIIFSIINGVYIFIHKKKFTTSKILDQTFIGIFLLIIAFLFFIIPFVGASHIEFSESFQFDIPLSLSITLYVLFTIIGSSLILDALRRCHEKSDQKAVAYKALSITGASLHLVNAVLFGIIPSLYSLMTNGEFSDFLLESPKINSLSTSANRGNLSTSANRGNLSTSANRGNLSTNVNKGNSSSTTANRGNLSTNVNKGNSSSTTANRGNLSTNANRGNLSTNANRGNSSPQLKINEILPASKLPKNIFQPRKRNQINNSAPPTKTNNSARNRSDKLNMSHIQSSPPFPSP